MAYKIVNDDSLTSVANAIRVKAEISGTLEFPDGFVSAIQSLSPSSGVDVPVFSATWTPDETPSGAITCNKTFNQCFSLVQRDYMYAAVIMNSFTYPNDPSTYPLYGGYEYIDGQACILYRNDYDYSRSIKYASDGTISVFDATDY